MLGLEALPILRPPLVSRGCCEASWFQGVAAAAVLA